MSRNWNRNPRTGYGVAAFLPPVPQLKLSLEPCGESIRAGDTGRNRCVSFMGG